mgnify:CR=1 FL=1
MLFRSGLDPARVGRYICHPGGAKVLTALETVLELPDGALDHERSVLAKYGNMSAPTVLFVLESVAKQGLPECVVLTSLGPGFTFSTLAIEQAA